MGVTIRFFGVFRSITGENELNINLRDTVSLREVIKEVVEKMPQLERTLIDSDLEDPRPHTLILVNDREASVLNGLETMLKDGDRIVLIPVLHTG